MNRIQTLPPLALLLAATALSAPAAAAPATGPDRYFTGSDLFNLEVAGDPQVSPDGRTIAYVRRSNDIMTDKARSTIWLVDVASGQQRPLLAGSGSYFSPRWSPDGSRLAYVAAEGASPQLYERWVAGGESARITDLPDSPGALAWSPDGRRIAYTMFVPDDPASLGKAPPKPEGAKWAEPLQVIDKVTYRSDDEGYLKAGYDQLFWVPADGGAPTQLTFGATHAGGPVSLDSRWPLDPVQRQPVEELGARARQQRDLSNHHRRRCASGADQSRRPRRLACRFSRRSAHRLHRLRRQEARLSEYASYRS